MPERAPTRLSQDAADRDGRMGPSRSGPAPSPNECGDVAAAWAAHGCAVRRDSARRPAGSAERPRCVRPGSLARMTLIAGLPGSNSGRPACGKSSAVTPGSATRIHTSACKAPRPRSNSVAWRSCSRRACASGPSAVSTVRPFMAQSACGRHNETRWLQLSRVVDSDANSRTSARGSIRMPPRAVTAVMQASPCNRVTGSSAQRMNSAIAPNVPKLQFVS